MERVIFFPVYRRRPREEHVKTLFVLNNDDKPLRSHENWLPVVVIIIVCMEARAVRLVTGTGGRVAWRLAAAQSNTVIKHFYRLFAPQPSAEWRAWWRWGGHPFSVCPRFFPTTKNKHAGPSTTGLPRQFIKPRTCRFNTTRLRRHPAVRFVG